MSDVGASQRGSAEERAARGEAMTSRGERDDVGRRVAASGAGSGRSGPAQGDLGRSGPVWVSWAGLNWFGPVWAGLGRSGPAWAVLGRFGPAGAALAVWTGRIGPGLGRPRRSGPVGSVWSGLVRTGSDQVWRGCVLDRPGWVGLGGLAWPGRPGLVKAGPAGLG